MRAALQKRFMENPLEPMNIEHLPVMMAKVLELLQCAPGGIYVDATLGMGGHGQAILERIQPDGLLIGVDRDRESLDKARVRLKDFSASIRYLHDNFKNLPLILNNLAVGPIDGFLLDLGVSSHQLLSPERGFSFQSEGMLDMRMDRTQSWTAADLVNSLSEAQIADIIYQYGEERLARRIASAIVSEREIAPITKCNQLADLVIRAMKVRGHHHTHPATKTFQALRIAVNQELEGLEELFDSILTFLKPGGRVVVLSFHSLEDRIVKRAFRKLAGQCVCDRPPELCTCPRKVLVRPLTQRPLTPGYEELAVNPRARSARLRSIEKI